MANSEEDEARKENLLPSMERRKVIKGIAATAGIICAPRSEERRVGKECVP